MHCCFRRPTEPLLFVPGQAIWNIRFLHFKLIPRKGHLSFFSLCYNTIDLPFDNSPMSTSLDVLGISSPPLKNGIRNWWNKITAAHPRAANFKAMKIPVVGSVSYIHNQLSVSFLFSRQLFRKRCLWNCFKGLAEICIRLYIIRWRCYKDISLRRCAHCRC